jgi:hypothetical protein
MSNPAFRLWILASIPLLAGTLTLNASPTAQAAEPINEQEAHAIGVTAYTYLYSLVTMDLTRKQLTNVAKAEGLSAPMNALPTSVHTRRRT